MGKNSLTPTCNFGSKYTIYLGCVKCQAAKLEGEITEVIFLRLEKIPRVRPSFQKH